MKKIKLLIIFTSFFAIIGTTYCAFSVNVEKIGTIEAKELSATFLNDTDFLEKVQTIDQTITSIDKNNDLVRSTDISDEYLNDSYIVSTSDSNMNIYLWVDNGTIYYYTVATTIDLNTN